MKRPAIHRAFNAKNNCGEKTWVAAKTDTSSKQQAMGLCRDFHMITRHQSTRINQFFHEPHLVLISLIYLFAHVWILTLGDATYWDDWTYFEAPASWILDDFRQAGSFLNISGGIYVALSSLGMWAYKFAILLVGLAIAVLWAVILERDMGFSKQECFWVVAIASALPLNPARVALINFYYTLCVLFFLIGWLAIEKRRLPAVVFLFFSFSTQSLLVFYFFPFIIFLRKIVLARSVSRNKAYLFLLILLPFIWFALKQIFFRPSEFYEGYNSISFTNLGDIALAQYDVTKEYLSADLGAIIRENPLILAACLLAVFLIVRRAKPTSSTSLKKTGLRLLVGCSMFIFACFPYWSVGQVAVFWEWDSRHQLLMPIGTAIIIFSLLSIINSWARKILLSAVITVSTTATVVNYKDFLADWNKQKLVISTIATSKVAPMCKLFVFKDATSTAIRRKLRFYEWSGLVNQAIPGEYNRLGINENEYADYELGDYDAYFSWFYPHHRFVRHDDIQECYVRLEYAADAINISIDSLK